MESGFDLADYLIRFSIDKFKKQPEKRQVSVTQSHVTPEPTRQIIKSEPQKSKFDPFPGSEDVIQFFNSFTPPPGPIRLSDQILITDIKLFIESHIEEMKANNGNPTFLPGFERIKKLMQLFN